LRRFASICSSIVDAIVRGGVVRARGSVLLCDAAEMRAGFLNSEKTYGQLSTRTFELPSKVPFGN
jgi:hypothetical protein